MIGLVQLVYNICDAFRDLLPFIQFKKREKHPRTRDIFGKVAGINNIFSSFLLQVIDNENFYDVLFSRVNPISC